MSAEREGVIDTEAVRHIAFLARLGLTDTEAEAFSRQLTTILDYFKLLGEAEVSTGLTADSGGVGFLRDDEVKPTLLREEFLASVPRRQGEYVLVPAVFPLEDPAERGKAEG